LRYQKKLPLSPKFDAVVLMHFAEEGWQILMAHARVLFSNSWFEPHGPDTLMKAEQKYSVCQESRY
jgi:hypothetical protein